MKGWTAKGRNKTYPMSFTCGQPFSKWHDAWSAYLSGSAFAKGHASPFSVLGLSSSLLILLHIAAAQSHTAHALTPTSSLCLSLLLARGMIGRVDAVKLRNIPVDALHPVRLRLPPRKGLPGVARRRGVSVLLYLVGLDAVANPVVCWGTRSGALFVFPRRKKAVRLVTLYKFQSPSDVAMYGQVLQRTLEYERVPVAARIPQELQKTTSRRASCCCCCCCCCVLLDG